MIRSRPVICGVLLSLLILDASLARADGLTEPERYGLGIVVGNSYDPSPTFNFLELTGVLQYEYGKVWPHRAPEPLYFKVEGSLGLVDYRDDYRLMSSVNMLAQYYPETWHSGHFRPYMEAGIGLIYTDFRVPGQGLRFNFNPQAGIGCDIRTEGVQVYFACLRIHHLSNGDLYHDNRGVNSVLLQFGKWF